MIRLWLKKEGVKVELTMYKMFPFSGAAPWTSPSSPFTFPLYPLAAGEMKNGALNSWPIIVVLC